MRYRDRYHAWFSRKAADGGAPTSFYAREDGTEVEVTLVDESEVVSPGYFDDAVYLGVVVRWVRPGSKDSSGKLDGEYR